MVTLFLFIMVISLFVIVVVDRKQRKKEQERIQRLEEQFLKRLHHKHKLKKPGEINEL
jgi:sensor domain CHASE-containing protein